MDKNASIESMAIMFEHHSESMAIMFEHHSSCLSSMAWNDDHDVVGRMQRLYEILEAAEEIVSEGISPWLRTTTIPGPTPLAPWENRDPVDSRLDGSNTFPVGGADLSIMQADVARSSSTLWDPLTSECGEDDPHRRSHVGGSCPNGSQDSSTDVASGCFDLHE